MEEFLASVSGVVPFLIYFVSAIVVVMVFMRIYTAITPHGEVELIKQDNAAAAVAYVGAMFGFMLPIASAIANSVSLIDFAIWAVIAGVIQLITFFIFRRFYPRISERIEAGEMGASIQLAGVSVMVGVLNAACIVY